MAFIWTDLWSTKVQSFPPPPLFLVPAFPVLQSRGSERHPAEVELKKDASKRVGEISKHTPSLKASKKAVQKRPRPRPRRFTFSDNIISRSDSETFKRMISARKNPTIEPAEPVFCPRKQKKQERKLKVRELKLIATINPKYFGEILNSFQNGKDSFYSDLDSATKDLFLKKAGMKSKDAIKSIDTRVRLPPMVSYLLIKNVL